MSMQVTNSVIKEPQQINFVAPAALNQDTVGTDALTGVNSFTPVTNDLLKDIRMLVNAAAGLNFTLLTRRLSQNRKIVGFTGDFITTNVRKPSAIGENGLLLNKGFFQWVEQQLAGALTAQSYIITYDVPLNV